MNQNKEIENIKFLKSISSQPEVFLDAQNTFLYNEEPSRFYLKNNETNTVGLPSSTDSFYLGASKHSLPNITDKIPKILNIGSGPEASRKLSAINTDISKDGKPDVLADTRYLPFRNDVFSVVRASHVLEHTDQSELESVLKEWKRVLHPNGELQVAVPDADITFQEIINGQTPKGQVSFSYEHSTAPLAQIYGLGYEAHDTDSRWLHKIIFSQSLLEYYLNSAGFKFIIKRTKENDLAAYDLVDDDSQNHYSLLMSARNEKMPHQVEEALPEKVFRQKCKDFRNNKYRNPNSSFIIPVQNESKNLPQFLTFLENTANYTNTAREFIFVINGSTDNSADIVERFLSQSYLNVCSISSKTGIMQAFLAGIEARKQDGFVGKIDVDTILHPHSLDLMQMHMVENPQIQATYAEPTPLDSQFEFNEAEHNPPIRSERLYIHGRASLYKNNPFKELTTLACLEDIQVEDIFLSFFYIYFYGFDAIDRTPYALVYSKTIKNLEDLAKQLSRTESEMDRLFKVYPPFKLLHQLLEREIYPSHYKDTVNDAKKYVTSNVKEWTRLESTK